MPQAAAAQHGHAPQPKMPWDKWSVRISVIVGALAIFGSTTTGLMSFADGRYQPKGEYVAMGDMQQLSSQIESLSTTIKEDRIERIEYLIERSESRLRALEVVPLADRDPTHLNRLMEEKQELEQLKRRLERAQES